MMSQWAVLFVLLVGSWGAWGQEPGLARRPDTPAGVSAVPPPMKVPATLETARAANGNGIYQALRQRIVNGEAFTVKGLVLRRDAGVITLVHGTVYLYGETAGKATGAVFLGEGVLHVEPPSAMERRQLKAVMKTEVLDQPFTTAVFAFTDGTAAELKKGSQGTVANSGVAQGRADDTKNLFRNELKYDLEARLLEDVIRPGEGGFFLAEMKGPLFSKRLVFEVDPNGALGVAPEEVALLTSSGFGYDVTLGFRAEAARKAKTEGTNDPFAIPQQTIDVTIEKSGKLTGTAVTAITARKNGVQVLPLDLFPTLRVSGVWGPNGEALDFVQEDRYKDAGLAVVLKKPLGVGEKVQITTMYAGKDAVLDEGNNNYYLVARESWYPNMSGAFGNYASYTMTFHTAKDIEVVATGNKVSDKEDGKQRTSVWQSMSPMPVAGFNLGTFKTKTSEHNKDVRVVSYANTTLANRYSQLPDAPGMALGTMSTTGMLEQATSEGDASIQIFTDFFGPLPYDHISLTQQTACNYGQSWPTLVYLPTCYFWDSTILHQLGMLDHDPTYWHVVTPHEVSHQWWGQMVGFQSYRDQWMSEGFANFSAALFLQMTQKTPKEYRDFWMLLRRRLLEKNEQGLRPVDVGPVVIGNRVDSSKTGHGVYQDLVYGKGAYILHSLEMLFWSRDHQEKPFKLAMHDFTSSCKNKPATTEDFKAVMEKNMPSWADLDGNHRLDWFFDAYVYGTATPRYAITSEFTKEGEKTTVHLKLTQSEVPDDFRMLVPIYLELEDKRVMLVGRAKMIGNMTIEQSINLGNMPGPAKRMVVNYNFDLLTEP